MSTAECGADHAGIGGADLVLHLQAAGQHVVAALATLRRSAGDPPLVPVPQGQVRLEGWAHQVQSVGTVLGIHGQEHAAEYAQPRHPAPPAWSGRSWSPSGPGVSPWPLPRSSASVVLGNRRRRGQLRRQRPAGRTGNPHQPLQGGTGHLHVGLRADQAICARRYVTCRLVRSTSLRAAKPSPRCGPIRGSIVVSRHFLPEALDLFGGLDRVVRRPYLD